MRYTHDSWSIELPLGWQVEESDEVISFFHPDGEGTFDVSTFFKEDGEITTADIIEFAEVDEPEESDLPYLKGIQKKELDGSECIFHWWLAAENQMIYATYVCETGKEDIEADERDTLISSLRSLYG